MSVDPQAKEKIAGYLSLARQAAQTGRLVLEHGDYVAAVNRAYYSIFYAASAMLASKGLERSKHSGVIADFRRHFIKTGIIEPEYSQYYGAAMDERHAGDYDMVPLDHDSAGHHLNNADLFLNRIVRALQETGTDDN